MKIVTRTGSIIAVILIILSSCTVSIGTSNFKLNPNETEVDQVKLDGSIIVEITDERFGAVYPTINISDDKVVEINVTRNQDEYQVDSTLRLGIEVLGSFTKNYPLGRYLTTLVLILRENGDLIDRMLWSIDRFDLTKMGETESIEIPLKYKTDVTSENATMRIFTLGTPTGILTKGKHVFAYKKVNLTFSYKAPMVEQYTLTINKNGNGIVTPPSGNSYPAGTVVNLEAIPDPGWAFAEWSGDLSGTDNATTITMDDNKTITANFTEIPPVYYTLTINKNGNGIVTPPSGGSYLAGTVLELEAIPDIGWVFDHWDGDVSSDTNHTTIMMDSDKTVTAHFSLFDTTPPITECFIEEI